MNFVSFDPADQRIADFTAVRREESGPQGPLARPSGARCIVAYGMGRPAARCAVTLAEDLNGAPGRSALIGHYEALDAAAGAALLRHTVESLAGQGVARVLGPIDGSTWARYRLALPSQPGIPDLEPRAFLGEPRNPWDYPDHFAAAGFTIAADYESRIDLHPVDVRPGADPLRSRLERQGITVRPLAPERYEEELRSLFDLSCDAFAGNLYYSPIGWEAFRAMYEPIRSRLDPELVRLARDTSGRLLGYLFAYPDVPGDDAPRLIAKTVATAPDARRRGLGMALVDDVRALAHQKGYGAVIHALMHVQNDSTRTSERHDSQLFRRYALYECRRSEYCSETLGALREAA